MKTIGDEGEKTQTSPVQLWNYNKRAGLEKKSQGKGGEMEKLETWEKVEKGKRWRNGKGRKELSQM